jgi:hypothetical protein
MRDRLTIVAGSLIVGASIVVAIAIHRPVVHCSYPGGAPPPGCITSDYSMTLRVEIVIAGFIVGLIILIGGRIWSHRTRQ